ncbi:UNVERIFIED_CONTAM: hypothetical protein FKN15_060788 [Acipenser sinensis]
MDIAGDEVRRRDNLCQENGKKYSCIPPIGATTLAVSSAAAQEDGSSGEDLELTDEEDAIQELSYAEFPDYNDPVGRDDYDVPMTHKDEDTNHMEPNEAMEEDLFDEMTFDANSPVYNESDLSKGQLLALLMAFSLRHGLYGCANHSDGTSIKLVIYGGTETATAAPPPLEMVTASPVLALDGSDDSSSGSRDGSNGIAGQYLHWYGCANHSDGTSSKLVIYGGTETATAAPPPLEMVTASPVLALDGSDDSSSGSRDGSNGIAGQYLHW